MKQRLPDPKSDENTRRVKIESSARPASASVTVPDQMDLAASNPELFHSPQNGLSGKLQEVQRQQVAMHIGQIQGNQRLQQMVAPGGGHAPVSLVIQRQPPEPTPGTDQATATQAGTPVAASSQKPQLPSQDEYSQLINQEINRTLAAFENIEIYVPLADPKPPKAEKAKPGKPAEQTPTAGPGASSSGQAAGAAALAGAAVGGIAGAIAGILLGAIPLANKVTVSTPYWINTEGRKKKRKKELSKKTNKAVRELFSTFPRAAQLGKSSPEELRASIQQAVNQGLIRKADGGWPPGKAEIEEWMRKVGLGVDCSGFVYQALVNASQKLAEKGVQGMQTAFSKNIINTGSGSLYSMGARVKSPSELRVGDVMYLTPSPVGHIRIIASVSPSEDGKGIEFSTAESTSSPHGPAGASGPTGVRWRYPDASKFKNLQVYKWVKPKPKKRKKGVAAPAAESPHWDWGKAGKRDQKAKFSHHFAASPQAAKEED